LQSLNSPYRNEPSKELPSAELNWRQASSSADNQLDLISMERKMPRGFSVRVLMSVLMGCLFATPSALYAALPQLWPTFSEPTSVVNIDILDSAASPDDLLAEKTLIGAYNQLQEPTRLYLSNNADDPYWIRALIPSSIKVSSLSWDRTDPDGALKVLLARYGSKIHGYYICDAINNPETCNMATTLAGIHQAMVVNPDNLAVMSAYRVPLLADLRSTVWIGDNPMLVNNRTINLIDNPSGGRGTAGWSTGGTNSDQTLVASTHQGAGAIQWTTAANQGRDTWVYFEPAVRLGTSYCYSVQVAGTGTVFLDAWDGIDEHISSTIKLASSYQTLQACIPIPMSDKSHPAALRVRSHTANIATTVYIVNAAVIESSVAVETTAYKYISRTTPLALAQEGNELYDNRDYDIAAKMFTFNLTSTDPAQKALYGDIINYTAHDTPIMGYPVAERDERPDVAFLSGLNEGHFLTASARYDNGSVWASLPRPSTLSQPAPAGIKAVNGTVYVAFAASEGDNMTYVEHRMQNVWTGSQFLGAVPMAWTIPPGAINFSPAMLSYYFRFVPQSSELMSGPGGVGYETAMTSADLSKFGAYTHEFMKAEDLSSLTSWQWATSDVPILAVAAAVPHLVWRFPYNYTVAGGTVIDGQVVSYNATPAMEIAKIESFVASNYSSSAPLFVEAMVDAWHLSPDDVLYIAQQLQTHSGHPYVFLTPSELALTEEAYHKGTGSSLAATNAQAVEGATLTAAFPNNVLINGNTLSSGSGMSQGGWVLGTTGHNVGLASTQYRGEHVQRLTVSENAGTTAYAGSSIKVPVVDRYYLFALKVAGTGTARMCVYDGTADNCGATVKLTTAFRKISMMVEIKSLTKGRLRLEIPEQTASAGTVYFQSSGSNVSDWFYARPGSGETVNLSTTFYNYTPAFLLTIPANQGNDQWIANEPNVTAGSAYNFSVDVAGSGQVYMDAYDGAASHRTSTVTLSGTYQTLTENGITMAGSGTPQLRVGSVTSAATAKIYFRNASVTPATGAIDFYSGLENGQTALRWTNSVDTGLGAGGESNVSSALTFLSSTAMSHGGSSAIKYSGFAKGGSATRAYLKIFSNRTKVSSTSRLNYWIFPQSRLGGEPGAASTTGRNSTCAAIDIVFTDGSALRKSDVRDQYGNRLTPRGECSHLIPGQWNYVSASLSSLSGKTISTVDVGYDQPGASGYYSGFIDDISLIH
jgi:hypothetical protein